MEWLHESVKRIEPQLIESRRWLHMHAELAWKEFETSAYIREELGKCKHMQVVSPTPTGVVGLLDTGLPGPTIALHADMDALPIQEQNGLSFASCHEGVMHACGHDGHAAILLYAAKIADERFDELVKEDAFYEWAHVHQNRYGTLKSVVSAELDQGSDLILEIDVQGCMNVLKQAQDAVSIFVSPPSCENLEKRLRDRGTETAESLRVRLGNVEKEVAQAYNYQYVIVHQDWNDVPDALSIAANEVYSIITAKRCELSAQKGFLDDLSAQLRDEQKI